MISVFRNLEGERKVLEAYDAILSKWPVPFKEVYVPTKLGETHVIICGKEDGEPLILIHAFYASAMSWYGTVEALGKDFRLYVVDIIGDPNKSRPVKLIRQIQDFPHWFEELMDGLLLEQADFAGNSVGAFHLANFALYSPSRFRRLVLIGPAATFLQMMKFYMNTFPGGMTGWNFLVKHAVRWIEGKVPYEPLFRDLFYKLMRYGKSANQVFPFVFSDAELSRLTMPVLLIYGEKETIYNYNQAIARAKSTIPNLKTVIIPNANHITPASRPFQVAEAIREFLSVG